MDLSHQDPSRDHMELDVHKERIENLKYKTEILEDAPAKGCPREFLPKLNYISMLNMYH